VGFATASTPYSENPPTGVWGHNECSVGYGVVGMSTGANGIGVGGSGEAYDFYAFGPGSNYGSFTGAHDVKLAESFPADAKPGMIVSVTGKAETRREGGRISLSSNLPTVTLSCRANDKAVFGVLVSQGGLVARHWHKPRKGERFGVANALGEGRVWVCDANGAIEAGDYITTSDVPGYGQKQHDDLLHNYTLGKAIETIDWDTVTQTIDHNGRKVKVYLLAVVYTSG
jgi:hypothetical protein